MSTNGLLEPETDTFGFPRKSVAAENRQPQAVLDFNSQQADENQQTSFQNPSKRVVGIELEPETLNQLEKLKGKNSNAIYQIKKFVLKRTNGQCAFPNCTKSTNHATMGITKHL